MSTDDQILVGEHNNKVFISVNGRGNFQNSHPMKEFALAKMEENKKAFIINLQKCSGMDSTFMGVLAGLAIKLQKKGDARLKLIQVSAHNRELLETLGLDRLMDVTESSEEQAIQGTPVEQTEPGKSEVAKHMLEAHETLSDLSEVNQVKFKNVIEYIKEDLGKNTE